MRPSIIHRFVTLTELTRPDVNKILVIRLSAIGDIVMSSGVLPALRSKYPNAHIAWLVEPSCANLLESSPLLDQVIRLPRSRWKQLKKDKQWRTLFREIWQFKRALKQQQFELVLDMQGLLKSGIWAYFSGAKHRFGLGSKEGSQHLMTQVIERQPDHPDISSEYRFMMQQLGICADHFIYHLAASPAQQKKVAELVANLNAGQKTKVILCPFTTRPQKHWFDDYWQSLIEQLSQQNCLPIILGGPSDQANAQLLVDASSGQAVNLAGCTQLIEAAELINNCDLVIGVDTGLTHMGIAQNKPTLALFGSTLPYSNTCRDNAQVLYHKMSCSPCRRRPTCDGAFTCMRQITPQQVMQAAKEWIS